MSREKLISLVDGGEEWLMERILHYAKKHGYTKYTSTLAEAWRTSIAGLSAPMVSALRELDSPPELGPDETFTDDPMAAFGILEARLHRTRGITLGMFLGLMKYYRQSYQDLLGQARLTSDEQLWCTRFVDRFFDRVELGFILEWSSLDEQKKLAELQDANRRLANEKNKYLTIFESLKEPAVFIGPDGRVVNANHAWALTFQGLRTPGAAYYRSTEPLTVPDWLEERLAGFGRGERNSCSFQATVETTKGLRHYLVRLETMLDVSEKFSGTVAVLHDITKTRQAEAVLQSSQVELEDRVRQRTSELTLANQLLKNEAAQRKKALLHLSESQKELKLQKEFLEKAIDSLTHPFYVVNPVSYEIVLANKAVGLMEGGGAVTCHEATHGSPEPCSSAECECPVSMVVRTGRPAMAEHVHTDSQGRHRFYEVYGYPLTSENGAVEEVIIYSLDVTARNQAMEESMRSAAALDQAHELIVITDERGSIQYVNPAFSRVTGYDKSEVLNRNLDFMVGDEGENPFGQNGLWKNLKRAEAWTGSLQNRKKDGTPYTVEASLAPVIDKHSRFTNAVMVMRDVTREMHLENLLRQAQKMEAVGSLAGGIAHDFNNILAAIIGFAELGVSAVEEGGDALEDLRKVLIASSRARDLVRRILTFSRQEEPVMVEVDLVSTVQEAMKMLRASLPSTIEFETVFPSRGITLMADPTALNQIVLNLCTNAFHAMEKTGGRLRVEVAEEVVDLDAIVRSPELRRGGYARLSIEDTGCGMAPDVQERIFDPFFTTKERGAGTGLGLSMVHGIVKNLGGTIKVRSRQGLGSTFHVLLPIGTGPAAKASSDTAGEKLGGRETVLLVDDEPDVLNVYANILRREGYEAVTCLSASEAIEHLGGHPGQVDLVITDLTMPRMTGLELTREIMRMAPGIPVILNTGSRDMLNDESVRASGVSQVLLKPLMKNELLRAVRRILDQSPAETRPPAGSAAGPGGEASSRAG